jgi:2',3'-cyclic-nucleotide 2'-phosphodiesterase (5'-nucleotidase family)
VNRSSTALLALLLAAAAWLCCAPVAPRGATPASASAPAASVVAPVAAPIRQLTVLYTSDEHGWMLPHGARGGSVALLHQWLATENHCVADRAGGCEGAATLALSGGDNWTGPAISSYFQGRPMAEAMRAMGYSASALGNHELDFGQPSLAANAKLQGYDFLAANVRWTEAISAPPVRPFSMVVRNGVRVGVVGIATSTTPSHLVPSATEGLSFGDEEAGLGDGISKAWAAGADVVVVVAHVCSGLLHEVISRHPDWRVSFAGGGHCHERKTLQAGATPVIEVGSELRWYARIPITVDLSRPQRDRVTSAQASLVEVGTSPTPAQLAPQAQRLHEQVERWKAAVDEQLGEVLGYSETGMERESPAMVRWLLGAWRRQLGADVALLNRYGMRQALEPGEVRARDLWGILPFQNKLVVMKLSGRDLLDNAQCCNGLLDGMQQRNNAWVLSDGRAVRPDATYVVVTADYAFLGGSGFRFRTQAREPQFGVDWREPIVQWMRANQSSRQQPLEKVVGP